MLMKASARVRFDLRPPAPRPLPALDCAGCRKCCEGDQITLVPSDDASLWRTETLPDGQIALARDSAGNCVYLGPQGCTIHDQTRPAKCSSFDCRAYYLMLERDPAALADRLGRLQNGPVVREGRRRIAEIRKSIAHV